MRNTDLIDGMKSGAVVAISSAPFGILFGALAVDNGMTVGQAVLMSAAVYGGASQIVGIELFGQHIAAWIVILSVLAVNFRHILYSAAISPVIAHFSGVQKALAFFLLVDPTFAETTKRAEQGTRITFRWYMAIAAFVYPSWLVTTFIGAYFGRLIGNPEALGFDLLPAIYFMGLLTGFRRRANFYPVVATSAVTSVMAYHFVGSPWHVSIGGAAGVFVAAIMPPRQALAAEPGRN